MTMLGREAGGCEREEQKLLLPLSGDEYSLPMVLEDLVSAKDSLKARVRASCTLRTPSREELAVSAASKQSLKYPQHFTFCFF